MADGLLIEVRASPGAQRDEVAARQAADGSVALIVKVRAQPERGKANAAVIATLAEALGLPKSRLALLKGAADRRKTLRVSGNPDELRALLRPLIEGQTHGADH